jgi:hypothetical protein
MPTCITARSLKRSKGARSHPQNPSAEGFLYRLQTCPRCRGGWWTAPRSFTWWPSPCELNLCRGESWMAGANNGSVPGPTIEANEGERVRVVFDNHLPR